ncbi:MAG: DUF4296 domain-containing protein [Prevotellaceae bacterium]|nr:DUF4296 domain-containing protein [Prevotellaceae bacterium]
MLKIKLILLASAITICFSACKSDDILSKKQLENMLFEMHLSDGVVHTVANSNQILNTDTIIRYKAIFEKYKCSRNKFEKSMRAYSRNRDAVTEIYENIKLRFDAMLKHYETKNFQNFTNNIINKFSLPFKNILSETDKYFEKIENIDDFVEQLMNLQKNIPETASDSAKVNVAVKEKTLEKSI